MSYTDSKVLCISEGIADGATIGFARNTTIVCRVNQPCDLYAVGAQIRVALDTAAATLTVTRRVTPYSDTDATAVAVITIPTLTPAGKIVWKAPTAPIKLNAGDELKFVFGDTGGGVYWNPWFEAFPRPETKENNADFLQSA
jgi:hypothetical protein